MVRLMGVDIVFMKAFYIRVVRVKLEIFSNIRNIRNIINIFFIIFRQFIKKIDLKKK